jgi:hypothetical protein
MKIIVKEFNAITGEETIIERDETANEAKERELYEAEQAERAVLQAEAEAAKAEATAKLAALGLTADDLKALGLGNN